MELEKDLNQKNIVKIGIEYKPINSFYIRMGIATNPSLSCFGIGINLKQFKVDIASSYHSTLGLSPQIGLTYQFGKKKTAKNDLPTN